MKFVRLDQVSVGVAIILGSLLAVSCDRPRADESVRVVTPGVIVPQAESIDPDDPNLVEPGNEGEVVAPLGEATGDVVEPLDGETGGAAPGLDPVTEPTEAELAEPGSVIARGDFLEAEQPTTGTAVIVETEDDRYLELGPGFRTGEAEDLQLLLDSAIVPPPAYEGVPSERYVELGGLDAASGNQRYLIPADIDPAEYETVVVVEPVTDTTFGYAPLDFVADAPDTPTAAAPATQPAPVEAPQALW